MKKEHHETDSEDDDDDSDIAFATMNFDGVDFDNETDETDNVVDLEEQLVFYSHSTKKKSGEEDDDNGDDEKTTQHCRYLARLVAEGKYLEAMNSLSGFFDLVVTNQGHESSSSSSSVGERLRLAVMEYGQESLEKCLELELLAIASLNFFLQLNYTGPTLEHLLRSDQKHIDVTKEAEQNAQRQLLERVHPHACFVGDFHKPPNDDNDEEEEEGTTQVNNDDNSSNKNNNNKSSPDASRSFQTAVLTELTVDGEWPCPVAQGPYFLWLARCILFTLTWPLRDDWKVSRGSTNTNDRPDGGNAPPSFLDWVSRLKAVSLWNARASVAHERLLQSRYPTTTLWQETKASFGRALDAYCSSIKDNDDNDKAISNEAAATLEDRQRAAMVVLEWGLAQHHSDRPGKGKLMFHKAQDYSGLKMGITGAMGKRTKFQQESKAQMLVHAESASAATRDKATASNEDTEGPTRVQHSEDEIRLERIAYEEDDDNLIKHLTILDQAIVLAFCLDVKNHNPADGLTAEEMGAYLARVLDHHDDWMVYSTALLERAWLEFESSHGRERALLQLQALLDQHTTRLTLTQSTFDSVESSAPAQERLVHLHSIVYPPRWVLQRDIAERYAALGIVTSAAELFQEIELWDDVVDCYQRAGKENKAEQIVRERLEHQPTPRMWAALGDITKEPEHYHEALKLSNGRYSDAFVALGHYHFDKGELQQAAEFYREAVKVRPLSPFVWFRLGTVSMQLHDWDSALHAFSEVVQQEPEESDAWANVAAVHMHNRQPLEAYPALNEVSLLFGWLLHQSILSLSDDA